MTHEYELMVILDPEIDERTVAPSLDKFLNVIRNDGGTIDNVDIWGRRRLAYEIQKKSEGIYAVVNFTATSARHDRARPPAEAVGGRAAHQGAPLRGGRRPRRLGPRRRRQARRAQGRRRREEPEGRRALAEAAAKADAAKAEPAEGRAAEKPAKAEAGRREAREGRRRPPSRGRRGRREARQGRPKAAKADADRRGEA